MKRSTIFVCCTVVAGCAHHKPSPVTVHVVAPQPVYLQPAPGRVVSGKLIDLPQTPSPVTEPTEPKPKPPVKSLVVSYIKH